MDMGSNYLRLIAPSPNETLSKTLTTLLQKVFSRTNSLMIPLSLEKHHLYEMNFEKNSDWLTWSKLKRNMIKNTVVDFPESAANSIQFNQKLYIRDENPKLWEP